MFIHPIEKARQIALRRWLEAIDTCGPRDEEERILAAKRRLDRRLQELRRTRNA